MSSSNITPLTPTTFLPSEFVPATVSTRFSGSGDFEAQSFPPCETSQFDQESEQPVMVRVTLPKKGERNFHKGIREGVYKQYKRNVKLKKKLEKVLAEILKMDEERTVGKRRSSFVV